LLEARHDPLRFALDLSRAYGDISHFRIGIYDGYLLNHPDYFRHVLRLNQRNYSKQNYNYDMLKPVLGEGLITSNGARWLRERRLIQPAFHHTRLARFGGDITRAARDMLRRWDGIAAAGQPLDVSVEMMALTLQAVAGALFDSDLGAASGTVARAFTDLNRDIAYRFRTVFVLPLWVPTARNRAFKAARAELDRIVYGIIDRRQRQAGSGDDLLATLLAARDERSGERMGATQVRDEVMTLLLAGHETTATLLSWTLYLLSQHPSVADRLSTELQIALAGRVPVVEDLPALPFTKCILQEALRLYPPVWIISRKALADDEIGGYTIPAGTTVVLCAYTLHRHPSFWRDPETFEPGRFSEPAGEATRQDAYFPFGDGPRACIGSHFAMMEARLILAMIAQRFRLQLVPGHPVEPEPLVTLRPRHGLKMTLHSSGGQHAPPAT
jgi:cytochrome P450